VYSIIFRTCNKIVMLLPLHGAYQLASFREMLVQCRHLSC